MKNNMHHKYKLVWSEEFENVTSIEQTVFTYQTTMKDNGLKLLRNNENIEFNNSCMILKTKQEPSNSSFSHSVPDGLLSNPKMSYIGGYLEMRAKVPFGKGAWPSFWLCAEDKYSAEDLGAEIDVFEVFSSNDTIVSNIHKWGYKDGPLKHVQLWDKSIKRSYTFKNITEASDWHRYGFEWTDTKYRFFVDDICYAEFGITEADDFSASFKGMKGFFLPHHIRINNFLFTKTSSDWVPDEWRLQENDVGEFEYVIDYFRLYQEPEKHKIFLNGKTDIN